MPGRVVERPRLLKLLDSGVDRPVTLIAAPAGALALVQLARDDPAGTVSTLSPFLTA
jgi:ATP/maltotriose-dependent transcriptional regulator MalT